MKHKFPRRDGAHAMLGRVSELFPSSVLVAEIDSLLEAV